MDNSSVLCFKWWRGGGGLHCVETQDRGVVVGGQAPSCVLSKGGWWWSTTNKVVDHHQINKINWVKIKNYCTFIRPKRPVKTGLTSLSQSWVIDKILRTKTKTRVLVFGSPGNLQSQIGLVWSPFQFFGGLVTKLPSTICHYIWIYCKMRYYSKTQLENSPRISKHV